MAVGEERLDLLRARRRAFRSGAGLAIGCPRRSLVAQTERPLDLPADEDAAGVAVDGKAVSAKGDGLAKVGPGRAAFWSGNPPEIG